MKILILSPQAVLLIPTIVACGDEVIIPEPMYVPASQGEAGYWVGASEIHPSDWPEVDYVVMFNYRHIVCGAPLEKYRGRIINIHTSVLPYNRGAHPNFWSWFDDTPKGVSIHRVDEGIDTGELLAAMTIRSFREPKTLRSTYNDLIVAAAGFFEYNWKKIRDNSYSKETIEIEGHDPSFHFKSESEPFMKMLPLGWDTPVGDVQTLGELYRGNSWAVLK